MVIGQIFLPYLRAFLVSLGFWVGPYQRWSSVIELLTQ
ncbi:hypothetical protein D046_1357 [Vibrio parahaemolyticus V-223/04]|nr:hypothetical protein D046_1357 [Vibrio parahaemolyticus V-223/04]